MSVRTSRSCVLFLILASFTTGCGIMASYPTILPNHETGARRPSDESPPSDEPPPREWIGEPTAWWKWS
ncbi:MAG: hypothetical protein KDC38_16775, partial [Planctomycetes bacterium]|nr:hypothetical protein [Planctomycetota bacterium]